MSYRISLPHHPAGGLCIVNGIRDLIHWRTGRDWSNEFVYGLGQGSGFAYIKFKAAQPPRQVYWGMATPHQHEYLARLTCAGYTIKENRTFKFAWNKACEALEASKPPILGPLDMFYLPYYEQIYHKRHIPLHYVLLVGHDAQKAYVHDTDKDDCQTIPLDELEQAWNVNAPAMGKKNRLVIFDFPEKLTASEELICRSIGDKCLAMLRPPMNMLGIPGMRKLAQEIRGWPEELGEQVAAACLQQAREYLNTPPDLTGDHLTATRDLYIGFLQEAGAITGKDFTSPITALSEAMVVIAELAPVIQKCELGAASALILRIAEIETKAYIALSEVVE